MKLKPSDYEQNLPKNFTAVRYMIEIFLKIIRIKPAFKIPCWKALP